MAGTASFHYVRGTVCSRRSMLKGSLMFAASFSLRAQKLNTAVTPCMRVILDNDFGGDPDGLFQAAHHLLSPSVQIPFVIGSHIHPHDLGRSSSTQAEDAVAMVRRLCSTIELEHEPLLIAGRNQAGMYAGESTAAQHIIAEAMRNDTKAASVLCFGRRPHRFSRGVAPRATHCLSHEAGMDRRPRISGFAARPPRPQPTGNTT